MPRVLISSYPIRKQPGPFRDILQSGGFETIDAPGDQVLTADELGDLLPTVDAILAGSEILSAELLANAPRLRVIARTGVGYDAVDVDAASRLGKVVTITPGTNQGSVAEQTFALLLALTRKIVVHDVIIKSGGWPRTLVQPLRGRVMGLVGLGRIGQALALRALAFEMTVIAHDPIPNEAFASAHGIELVSFEDLLARSDVVSLHLPLIPSTRGLIRRETLARMKPGTLFINTSRGGLVVEADLVEALRSGQVGGAGLDVFDQEPPDPRNPLLSLSNVVVSPHLGGLDSQSMSDMAALAARCVVDLHQGRWPDSCIVNPEIGPGWRW